MQQINIPTDPLDRLEFYADYSKKYIMYVSREYDINIGDVAQKAMNGLAALKNLIENMEQYSGLVNNYTLNEYVIPNCGQTFSSLLVNVKRTYDMLFEKVVMGK
jgi:hypothetical protein